MNHQKQPTFINWECATSELAYYFKVRYFDKEADSYWIADEVGGVYVIADYFFNIGDMVDFLRHNYTKKDMFTYYDHALDCATNHKECLNIKTWRHLKK